jgi:hypothetical protein
VTNDAPRPPAFALRPLYRELLTGDVTYHALSADGTLDQALASMSLRQVDVEAWATRFLGQLDRVLTEPFVVAIMRRRSAAPAVERLRAAKHSLANSIARGVAPVSGATDGPGVEACRRAAAAVETRILAGTLREGCALPIAPGVGEPPPAYHGYSAGRSTLPPLPALPPLRALPAPPILAAEGASQARDSVPATLDDAKRWVLRLTCLHEMAAQDVLTLSVAITPSTRSHDDPDLAEALAQYGAVAEQLERQLDQYLRPLTSEPPAVTALLDHAALTFAALCEEVARAWSVHWTPRFLRQAELDPAASCCTFDLRLLRDREGATTGVVLTRRRTLASAEPAASWPTIALCTGGDRFAELTAMVSEGDRREYLLPSAGGDGGRPALRFMWSGLDITAVRWGHIAAVVTRNGELGGEGATTHAEFVLASPEAVLGDIGAPELSWTGDIALVGADFVDALENALTPLVGPSSALSVRVEVHYRYEMVPGMVTEIPVILISRPSNEPGLAVTIADAAEEWRARQQPETGSASWRVSLELSAPDGGALLLSMPNLLFPLATPGELADATSG